MLKFGHVMWIVISGMIWLLVGLYLLPLGLNLLLTASKQSPEVVTSQYPLLSTINAFILRLDYSALIMITGGLILGYLKARFVLIKSVQRIVSKILSKRSPISISQVYGIGYYMLIGIMILLGMSMKWLQLPNDIRGFVDVAIGAALINGACIYFRTAAAIQKQSSAGGCCGEVKVDGTCMNPVKGTDCSK